MAKVLILGGGFGGVIAAETLAKKLRNNHEITLVSRSRRFLFYPDYSGWHLGTARRRTSVLISARRC